MQRNTAGAVGDLVEHVEAELPLAGDRRGDLARCGAVERPEGDAGDDSVVELDRATVTCS